MWGSALQHGYSYLVGLTLLKIRIVFTTDCVYYTIYIYIYTHYIVFNHVFVRKHIQSCIQTDFSIQHTSVVQQFNMSNIYCNSEYIASMLLVYTIILLVYSIIGILNILAFFGPEVGEFGLVCAVRAKCCSSPMPCSVAWEKDKNCRPWNDVWDDVRDDVEAGIWTIWIHSETVSSQMGPKTIHIWVTSLDNPHWDLRCLSSVVPMCTTPH